MGLKIATYKNRVKTLVPGYDLNTHTKPNPETITVTRNSVEDAQYASWSQGEEQEGMYIQAHSIEDGNLNGYKLNQLVAIVDLNYRYLSPINETVYGGTLPYQLGPGGCIEIDNLAKTIIKEQDPPQNYIFKLTPQQGYSMIPAGHVEVRIGDTWTAINGANWSDTEITPSLPGVTVTITPDKIVGNLRFVLNDCKYKVIAHKIVDGQDVATSTFILSCNSAIITINSIRSQFDSVSLNYVGATKDSAGTTQANDTYLQDCGGDRDVYLNYTTKDYTIDSSGVVSECVNLQLTSDGQPVTSGTISHGSQLTITLTPTQNYINIGPGQVTMVGQQAPVEEWSNNQLSKEITIQEVTGNISISASCGDLKNHLVTLRLFKYESELQQTLIATRNTSAQHGDRVTPSQYTNIFITNNDVPTGWSITSSNPNLNTEIIINDDETIDYFCTRNQYTVTFVAGDGITLNQNVGGSVLYDQTFSQSRVYTVNSGYSAENVTAVVTTGTAGSPTCGAENSVSIPNVQSNITVTISADSIPTHLYCVSFSIDQAGTFGSDPDKTSRYCLIIQEGTCHEDIPYSLNSGYEIYGEIPNQITINADNTIDVCNITKDVNLVIPVRLVTHTVKYCLTDGLGISLIGAQGQCITKNVVHGLNSTQGFSLTSGYNSVIVDSITPQDKPYNIDYGNNTININNITENVEIWMHAGAIPDQNVTFKLFIDGVEQPDREKTKSVAYGSIANNAFRSLGIVIDRTDINVTADVAGVTTDYNVLSDVAIGVSGTPITEATVITTYLKSVPQKEVLSIEVTSSKMDAMGGVVFNGKINYSDETFDIITDQEEFNQKFEIRDSNNNLYDTTVVNVHDYDFEPTRNNSSSSVKDVEGNDISGGEKSEIQKTKLNLENTDKDDVRYSLTKHNYTNRDITISLNNSDKSVSLTIPLRNEKYGYYKGGDISSTSDTSQLDKNYWCNNNYLTNFGDSVEMYKAPSDSIPDYLEGLDIYNKDVTPYYITGTYIGEDPLENLSGNKHTIIGLHKSYNTINSYINEHYHITWGEQKVGDDPILGKAFRKGCIFIRDNFTNSSGICGGIPPEPSTDVCPTSYSDKSVAVLEALGTNYNNNNPYNKIQKDINYDYIIKYNIPEHNYGIDSVSYYHIEDSPYRVEVENSIFKDEDEQDKQWSYPLHINTYILSPTDTDIYYLGGIGADPNTGAGPTLGMIRSIRWNKNTNSYASYPSDLDYKDDSYNIYFDYNNKVDLYSDEYNDYLTFSKYNSEAYNPLVSNLFNNVQLTSYVDPFYIGKAPYGRIIDAYCTFMSSETLIRPIVESDTNDIKFVVLNSAYNNRGNVSGNNTQNSVKEISIRDYCAIQARRCRFISEAVVYDLLNQGYLEHRDDAIQGTVNINDNNYVVPAYVNYPYNMADDYNFDYEHIWVPDNEEYPDNGKKVKGELIYHPNTQEWQVAIYRPKTETESARYEYRNIDPDILSNEENFSRNIYNVSGVTQYRQCYNNPNSEDFIEESPNFYAHNDSDAKFAVCTYNFHTGNSARFFKQGLDVTADILRAKVTNVTRERIDLYTIVYKFVTCDPVSNISEVEDGKNVTYVNDIQLISSENGKYYYRETLNNSDSGFVIYTNASEIKLTMANLDENNYPYGLGNVTAILDDGVETKSWNYEELVYDNELMHFDQLSGDHKLAIIVSSASHPEYNRTYQGEDRIELSQVLTGGNVIRVTCTGNHLTKQFLVPFGGSCSRRPNHANSSGIDLSWEELFKYYLEGYQDYTLPFTNKGNSLKVINLFNESGDTIVGYVDLSNL